MSDPMKDAWREVEDGFSTLGRMMRERYHGPANETATDPETQADSAEAGAALREAFEQLVAAGRDLGERAAEVVHDDEIRTQARRAATSLNDALSATVELIGDQVTGLFKRAPSDDTRHEVPRSTPPADDARQ